jgi:hypothetical protein
MGHKRPVKSRPRCIRADRPQKPNSNQSVNPRMFYNEGGRKFKKPPLFGNLFFGAEHFFPMPHNTITSALTTFCQCNLEGKE